MKCNPQLPRNIKFLTNCGAQVVTIVPPVFPTIMKPKS